MQKIDIYSPTLERTGAIYGWASLVWRDSYNEGGKFQLEVAPLAELRALLTPDSFLRYSEAGTMMVIETIQIEDGTMTISGSDAAHILASRVTTSKITSAYAQFTDSAETAIRNAVTMYKGDWDIVTVGDSKSYTVAYTGEYAADELESAIQSVAQEADMGYRLNFDEENRKLVLDVYRPGVNENAIYAPIYGNVSDVSYTYSTKSYKNVCRAMYPYSDDRSAYNSYKVVATVGDTGKTGCERREMVLIVSSDDEINSVRTAAAEALAEQSELISVECSISGGAELGDIITVKIPELNVSVQRRVKQRTITAQNGALERTYTIGELLSTSTIRTSDGHCTTRPYIPYPVTQTTTTT